jgi:carbonic anhydrase/acetyltransferase-like protein (isoleucine patch superfamily)
VGKTVVERWIDRVRQLGVGIVSVVDRDEQSPARITDWVKEGVDQILLILSGSYAEIDFADLIQFHHHGRNRITRVFDKKGPLGISLLNRGAVLKNGVRCGLDETVKSSRYNFLGYVSRLSSTMAYRQLVEDALDGRCGIQPAGHQADEKIWIDPTARVDASANIQGPCYIGAHTRIHAGVVVTGYSSIEQNCEIDMGTTLDHACILPNTYLAPGLHVRNSVVDGTRLEHLDKGVTVDLGRAALAARRYHVPSAVSRGANPASDSPNVIRCDWGTDAQSPTASGEITRDV